MSHPPASQTTVLFVGIYDDNTVSLAPALLKAYVDASPLGARLNTSACDYSIFSDNAKAMAAKINAYSADIVCFSTYVWNLDMIREATNDIDATIFLGGPHTTGIEQDLLTEMPNVDLIVTGEGEKVMVEVFARYLDGQSYEGIPGTTSREHSMPPRAELIDLAEIPEIYEEALARNAKISWIALETSRGCPNGCRYCAWGYSRKMRYYPLDRVLRELDHILSHDSIETIYLCDSSLLWNRKRAKTILAHIADSGSPTSLRFEFNAEHLDDEIIAILGRMHRMEFNLGLQTVNPRALEAIDRGFNREKFETNFNKMAAVFGMDSLTVDLIYGLPGDNYEGYKASMEYVWSLGPVKRVLTNPLILLPGSEFFKRQTEYGIRIQDKKSWMVTETASFSAEDLANARKLSFYVNIVFLNGALRDGIMAFATETGRSHVAVLEALFDRLPAEMLPEEYPDFIPSNPDGFAGRNEAVRPFIENYGVLAETFADMAGETGQAVLESFESRHNDQFYKFRRFIGLDG